MKKIKLIAHYRGHDGMAASVRYSIMLAGR